MSLCCRYFAMVGACYPVPFISPAQSRLVPDKPVHDIILSHQHIFGQPQFVNHSIIHVVMLFLMLSIGHLISSDVESSITGKTERGWAVHFLFLQMLSGYEFPVHCVIVLTTGICMLCLSGSTQCQWSRFTCRASVRTDTEHCCTLCWQSMVVSDSLNSNNDNDCDNSSNTAASVMSFMSS